MLVQYFELFQTKVKFLMIEACYIGFYELSNFPLFQ